MEKEFDESKLIRKQIVYPAYQTTKRFHNLYTDVRTFVRELIQNADDAEAKSIVLNINLSDEITVTNDGRVFDSRDIERLLTPCLGGKELEKTGAMNLGALSVLSISDQPLYHSGKKVLKFVMDHEKEDFVPYIDENNEMYFKGTKIHLPLHKRLSKEDIKKLGKIDEYLLHYSHLLFTIQLEKIEVNYPTKSLILTKKINQQKTHKHKRNKALISEILITEKRNDGKRNKINTNKWLIVEQKIDIPKKYFSQKEFESYEGDVVFPIYIAFKKISGDIPVRVNYPIYIIFPSDTQFGFGFVLSSNFRPETSRKGFSTEGLDGELNNFLLEEAGNLIKLVLDYLKEKISDLPLKKRIKYFNSLLNVLSYRKTHTSLEPYIEQYILDNIKSFLSKNILDYKGNWNKAKKIVIAEKGLWPFFNYHYNFIEPPSSEKLIDFLKSLGIKELSIEDLVDKFANKEIRNIETLYKAWEYLSIHRDSLDKELRCKLTQSETVPNRLNRLSSPVKIIIPNEDAIGLYDPTKELSSKFATNEVLTSFVRKFGARNMKKTDVLLYFISIKSRLSVKNLDLLKKYYNYFYKNGIYEKKQKIVLTNMGFRNSKEAFFNSEDIVSILKTNIPLVPPELEKEKICKVYLKSLGVSSELNPSFVVKHLRRYGSSIVSIKLLTYLSDNVKNLTDHDLDTLKDLEIIPTTTNEFLRPSECYFNTKKNQKIFGDLVHYFNLEDEQNKDFIKFFKKIGISKYPKIRHLRLALNQTISEYEDLDKTSKKKISSLVKRVELILDSVFKNKEKDEKEIFINELKEEPWMITTKGLFKPKESYLMEKKLIDLLGHSVPYTLINVPDKFIKAFKIRKKPNPEDVASHLLDFLVSKKKIPKEELKNKKEITRRFDKIYSYLGRTENFEKLSHKTKKRLLKDKVVYLLEHNCFEVGSRLIMYSRDAEMIFGDNIRSIKHSSYPNSLNFFKLIGVKTNISTDDIGDFLIQYISRGEIETKRLFMLYNL
ncbi:MAG: hypothetical protein GF353_05685, partial [Candidatus Lokiarchaeota archaeon]|nr:hypothetical protein [Candidatus Lokiarchaeota archaeon]